MAGLGDIAQKAYLPVLATRSDIELHLATRNTTTLRDLGERWRILGLHASLKDALEAEHFDAAFVHAATGAHPAMVEALLTAGIPVLVDKPLADNWQTAAQLAALADEKNIALRVGFNRRYASVYTALRDQSPSWVRMEKNRRGPLQSARRTIFDDFIHVVDTLRFLSPASTQIASIATVLRGGLLEAVQLTLSGHGFLATGSMHRASGIDEERLDVFGGGRRRTVHDMARVIVAEDGAERATRRGDWSAVEDQRGFASLCEHFLASVRSGANPDCCDLMETHRICEALVAQAEEDGGVHGDSDLYGAAQRDAIACAPHQLSSS